MNTQLVPGVIGGMGPEATIELMYRIFKQTPAKDDQDHIRLLVDNNPKIPSRIKAIIEKNGESPVSEMVKMAKGLVSQGADFLVIPCNTAHYYYQDVAKAVDIPVINIIEITAKKIKENEYSNVLILGSTALQITNIYKDIFDCYGICYTYPRDGHQEQLMDLIKNIKSKSYSTNDLKIISNIQEEKYGKKIDCLLLACTELSVIKNYISNNIPMLDAIDILSQEIIYRALNNKQN